MYCLHGTFQGSRLIKVGKERILNISDSFQRGDSAIFVHECRINHLYVFVQGTNSNLTVFVTLKAISGRRTAGVWRLEELIFGMCEFWAIQHQLSEVSLPQVIFFYFNRNLIGSLSTTGANGSLRRHPKVEIT